MTNTQTTQTDTFAADLFVSGVRALDSALAEWHQGRNRKPEMVLDINDLTPMVFPWDDDRYCR